MICDVLQHPEALLSPCVLRPWGDTISKATWRKESTFELDHWRCHDHRFPEEGCHGVPLERDAPNRTDIP